jgi:hypothetical protein
VDREHVLEWLRSLSPPELADLLYEVWADWPRSPADYYGGGHMPNGDPRYALAEIGFYDGWAENVERPRCEAQFVARDAAGEMPPPGFELWESGECPLCHAFLTSWSKQARCPICGTECGLT